MVTESFKVVDEGGQKVMIESYDFDQTHYYHGGEHKVVSVSITLYEQIVLILLVGVVHQDS